MTYFENWLKSLSNQKKSENTILAYKRDVNHFLLASFETVDDLTAEEYEEVDIDFVYDYLNDNGFADSTKNRKQIAIHLFWGFLFERGIISKNKIEKTKLITLEEAISDAFSLEEVQEIYDRVNNSPYKRCVKRDQAIMGIMLSIPVRKSEIRKLLREDYTDKGCLVFRARKGKRNTVVGLPRDVIVDIDRYLAERNDDLPWLFVTENNTQMGVDALDNLVAKYAQCNPHRLRATAATMLYRAGVPIETVESIGGWEKGSKTLRNNYLRIDEDTMRNALEQVNAFVKKGGNT